MAKNPPAIQETQIQSLGREDPLEKGRQPNPVFLLKKFHGQRSLAGNISSVQYNSVTQSCLTPCNPTDCSMPGSPIHNQLPETTQTHIHQVGDAIQPYHPLSLLLLPSIFSSIRSFPMSWFFASGSQSIGVSASASVLPVNIQD